MQSRGRTWGPRAALGLLPQPWAETNRPTVPWSLKSVIGERAAPQANMGPWFASLAGRMDVLRYPP